MRPSRLFCLALAAALLHGRAGAEEKKGAYTGLLSLVRYEMPIGLSDGFAPTRQLAERRAGEDAIDWPDFTLNGAPLFQDRAEERVPLKLRSGTEAASPFQLRSDDVVQPGNHWLRAMNWRGGRRHIYTADRAARTAASTETMSGRYELWTFPLHISGEGGPGVKNIELRAGANTIYKKDGPWRSLTLLLPASEPGRPYELIVDGRAPLKVEIGLLPTKAGAPRDRLISFDASVPGDGPKVRVQTLSRAEIFPNPKEWAADVAALQQPASKPLKFDRPPGMARYLGVEVPRSPLLIYAAQLPGGQSGGFFKPGDSEETYAAHVAKLGFDAVFDQANSLPEAGQPGSFETRAAALARHGVKLGLEYDNNSARPSLQSPALPLLAHTLPEWHAPLYRSLSLAAERFARLPNFLGLCVGANSSGYAGDWQTAPPSPDRPWGEAMVEFIGKPQPAIPRAPQAGPPQMPIEYVAKDTADFIRYVQRYEAAFQEYEYFAEAVRQAAPKMVFTTSAFGSAPGAGARGGWPWASLPGRSIFNGLNVQQAYDFNQTHGAKPMQNEALTDRLVSYWEKKTTWSLVDNFGLLYGREAYQRACVLALSRGIQGLGTNFLPPSTSDTTAAEVEMHAWIHRFGGVYATLKPDATIGIFYGQHQAVQRPVITEAEPAGNRLYEGSQEGKVTEALFLCHAAGWPARVITYQEIMRGPLPAGMKAILIVGGEQTDASWTWGPGLEKPLQQFLAGGGRIIVDATSSCPVPCIGTQLRVAAYQPQSQLDFTPLLLQRNADNIQRLRAAMEGVATPVAASAEPTVWALPAIAGDVQYVTVINQGTAEGEDAKTYERPADPRATRPETWKTRANASLYVRPQTGTLAWKTDRPIYDLRLSRKLEPAEAARVDLTKDAFQFYALPPGVPTTPRVSVARAASGFYEATVETGAPSAMAGIPVRLEIAHGEEKAEVFGATGAAIRLPLHERDAIGEYRVVATELLSGLTGETAVQVLAPQAKTSVQNAIVLRDSGAVAKFASRTAPLTIALTPEQAKDSGTMEQAKLLQEYYRRAKRSVTIAQVQPGGVVESLQPLRSPHRYPQWKTVAADLILMGLPTDNVLLLDQQRAGIFPLNFRAPPAGKADVIYTRSPFVGECDALNILAPDLPSLTAAVKTLIAAPVSPHPAP